MAGGGEEGDCHKTEGRYGKNSENGEQIKANDQQWRWTGQGASHSPRAEPSRLTVRIGNPTDRVRLLDPTTLEMTLKPVIIGILNPDPGRPGVGERRGLGINTVPLIMISDEGRVFSGLVIGRRQHFAGTRNELVERG
jgi:hypothetical protein